VTDKKKGFEPPASSTPKPEGTASSSTPPASTPAPGSRAAARRTGSSPSPKVSPEPQGFLEKYRFLLLIGIVVVGLGALAFVFMQSATAAPYKCTTLMTPGPTDPIPTPRPEASAAPLASVAPAASAAPGASAAPVASVTPAPTPEPQPTQRLGFVAQDLGAGHVSESTSITYAYCPPTSGQHFNVANLAPLPHRLYNPSDSLKPGNWVHNLEHGYVVLLYKGDPGKDVLARLGNIVDTAPGTDFTTTKCGAPNKVIAVRFDDMTTPFAAVSWDRALLLDTFDEAQLRTFAEQWQESPVWPETGVC